LFHLIKSQPASVLKLLNMADGATDRAKHLFAGVRRTSRQRSIARWSPWSLSNKLRERFDIVVAGFIGIRHLIKSGTDAVDKSSIETSAL